MRVLVARSELASLAERRTGSSAVTLLALLRAEHGSEPFTFIIKDLVASRYIGSWSARRYRVARDALLGSGLLLEVRPAWSRGYPALYRVTSPPPERRHRLARGECRYCDEHVSEFHPPHDASDRCESGGRSHCSCDVCF